MHIQNPNLKTPDPEAWMLETSEEKYLNPAKFYRLKKWRREAWNWHGDLFITYQVLMDQVSLPALVAEMLNLVKILS